MIWEEDNILHFHVVVVIIGVHALISVRKSLLETSTVYMWHTVHTVHINVPDGVFTVREHGVRPRPSWRPQLHQTHEWKHHSHFSAISSPKVKHTHTNRCFRRLSFVSDWSLCVNLFHWKHRKRGCNAERASMFISKTRVLRLMSELVLSARLCRLIEWILLRECGTITWERHR